VEPLPATQLRIGAWRVDPLSCQISRDAETVRIEARAMRLLLCLAEHAGEVVSIDELLNRAWSGVVVSQDSVYQAVASLRRVLGDDPKQPAYIETVPRLGYRMVAEVSPWTDQSTPRNGSSGGFSGEHVAASVDDVTSPHSHSRFRAVWIAGAALCVIVGVAAFLFAGKILDSHAAEGDVSPQSLKSVAVLPFQDLTDEMTQEPFADGMTVELIDKLSKISGLRVHAPMSPTSLKGKRIAIAAMAKMLDVAYVLDGSVRKSGARLRVTARLIHANDEYVVWSQTYDRPFDDVLKVQDDIAGEVTKALTVSIGARSDNRAAGQSR
jgi:TolB-like protein/DNA-binding winged helix-turn-helix (wHTH) protein